MAAARSGGALQPGDAGKTFVQLITQAAQYHATGSKEQGADDDESKWKKVKEHNFGKRPKPKEVPERELSDSESNDGKPLQQEQPRCANCVAACTTVCGSFAAPLLRCSNAAVGLVLSCAHTFCGLRNLPPWLVALPLLLFAQVLALCALAPRLEAADIMLASGALAAGCALVALTPAFWDANDVTATNVALALALLVLGVSSHLLAQSRALAGAPTQDVQATAFSDAGAADDKFATSADALVSLCGVTIPVLLLIALALAHPVLRRCLPRLPSLRKRPAAKVHAADGERRTPGEEEWGEYAGEYDDEYGGEYEDEYEDEYGYDEEYNGGNEAAGGEGGRASGVRKVPRGYQPPATGCRGWLLLLFRALLLGAGIGAAVATSLRLEVAERSAAKALSTCVWTGATPKLPLRAGYFAGGWFDRPDVPFSGSVAEVNASLAFPLPHRATQVALRAVTAIKARRCSLPVLPFSLRLVPSLTVLDLALNNVETLPSPSSKPAAGLVLAPEFVAARAAILANALPRLRRVDLRENENLGRVSIGSGFAVATAQQLTWFWARLPRLEILDLRRNAHVGINATSMATQTGLTCFGSTSETLICCGRPGQQFIHQDGDPCT